MASAKFILGSDHGGVVLREQLAAHLSARGIEVLQTCGPASAETSVDYPDVAQEVCALVGGATGVLGLLVCGTGQGMAISANKVPGIRAGVASDPFSARMLRAHNDAQVLCVGERVLGVELAKVVLDAFIDGAFEGGRHQRRVDKIAAGRQGG